MNMQPVTGKLCFVFCIQCTEQTAIGDGAEGFRNSFAYREAPVFDR